jgi:hypothetical protein
VPIHSFDFSDIDNGKKLVSTQFDPMTSKGLLERAPAVPTTLLVEKKRDDIWFERQNVDISQEVREILPQGFRTMDRGIKNYFSGIRIPTRDGVKLLQVRVTGGDKPYLIWKQDLQRGRVTLPVMSIKRDNTEAFPEKFSPAHHHYMSKRFADKDLTRIILTYRPIPRKLNYSLSVWAEHKRDLEYALYQIESRFHPIAEYYVEDEYLRMPIILHYNGMTPSVDEEVPADQRQNKRYDYSVQMEGYLPLPERIVPSILGRVTTLKDGGDLFFGDVFQTVESKEQVPLGFGR